jgi:hypothetical protein
VTDYVKYLSYSYKEIASIIGGMTSIIEGMTSIIGGMNRRNE